MIRWNEVLTRLQKMSAEELDQNATIKYGPDDFCGVTGFGVSKDGDAADGILDHGHFYFDCLL